MMRLAGHVAGMGERRFIYSVSKGKLRERSNLEDLDLKIRIIMK
jgi:hypothetical protein